MIGYRDILKGGISRVQIIGCCLKHPTFTVKSGAGFTLLEHYYSIVLFYNYNNFLHIIAFSLDNSDHTSRFNGNYYGNNSNKVRLYMKDILMKNKNLHD